jgi:hypothetical protein
MKAVKVRVRINNVTASTRHAPCMRLLSSSHVHRLDEVNIDWSFINYHMHIF